MKDELPCDTQIEAALIGSILIDNEEFFEEAETLKVTDFYLSSHQTIYAAIVRILLGEVEGVTRADIATLLHELGRHGQVALVGGAGYLSGLTDGLSRRPKIKEYVGIVKEYARKRRLAKIGQSLYSNALAKETESGQLIESVNIQIAEEESEDEDEGAVKAGSLTEAINARLLRERNQSFDKVELAMTWGIEVLDKKTKGVFGGEVTVVGGDSGSGKTAFVAQMAIENAKKGTVVCIFSIEMGRELLIGRTYPLFSEVITADLMRDPRGMTKHTHVPELDKIAAAISKLPLYVDDTAPLTLSRLLAKMRKSIRRHDTKLFIVDYLQLIQVPGQKDLQRFEAIMFGLRDFFKKKENETRHLVLLSQYTKEQGGFKKKRRTKGDLHGGAVIHQAAQNVILITVENPDKKEPGSCLDVEIMIDKQRAGSVGRLVCQRDPTNLRYIPAPPQPENPNDQPARKRGRPRKDGGGTQSASEDAIRDDPG